jgi:hypothetical protein
MKGVNNFNMENLVTNEWPRDLIGGNINVSELLDVPKHAKINHVKDFYNWFQDGGKEILLPSKQGGPRVATSPPLGKQCSLGRNGIPKLHSKLSGLYFTREGDRFLYDYVDCLAKDVVKLQALRTIMKKLRSKEMKLEGEVMELYRLRKQEKTFVEMEQRLLKQIANTSNLEA